MWMEEIETMEGLTTKIHNEGLKDSPIPEVPVPLFLRGTASRPLLPGTFQKWETEWVCFVLPRNFPFLERP